MIKFLKQLFKRPTSSGHLTTYTTPVGTEMILAVPSDRLPQDFLDELAKHFNDLGIVRQAAYCLKAVADDFSFFIMLDLEVSEDRQEDALQEIVSFVHAFSTVSYKARWPIDYGLWSEQIITNLISQEPELQIFKRTSHAP